jgi:hypothetical protein
MMKMNRLIQEAVEEILRACTNGEFNGLGCDARMVSSSLEGWKSPFAKSITLGDDIESFLPIFRKMLQIHWEISDALEDICKESMPRSYDSDSVVLNRVVIENLASVLESSVLITDVSRAAIRWSAAVSAVHHSRRCDRIRKGIEFTFDLAKSAELSETTTRLGRLLEFGAENGFDDEILLAQAQSWDMPDSITKGLIHALSIDVNCDEPLYALSGME